MVVTNAGKAYAGMSQHKGFDRGTRRAFPSLFEMPRALPECTGPRMTSPPKPRPPLRPRGHSSRFSALKGQGAAGTIKCADMLSLILLFWAKKMKRSWFNSASKYLEKKERVLYFEVSKKQASGGPRGPTLRAHPPRKDITSTLG